MHFFAKIFAHIEKKQYFCDRFKQGIEWIKQNYLITN